MKRSRQIQLAALSILGMAACSTHQAPLADPCKPDTYNDIACQSAVNNQGYYSHGVFVYGNYSQPYLSYYQRYQAYSAAGGQSHATATEAYTAHGSGGGEGEGSVSRGGFGGSGEGAGE